MITKKYRIPRNRIDYLLEKGTQTSLRLFIIRYKKNAEQFNRYRVIISRKLEEKAVKRNRLRRQVYEAIRLSQGRQAPQPERSQKHQHEHFDLLLIPKKAILNATFQTIKEDINRTTNLNYGKIK